VLGRRDLPEEHGVFVTDLQDARRGEDWGDMGIENTEPVSSRQNWMAARSLTAFALFAVMAKKRNSAVAHCSSVAQW
jgi:hypothetical protein